MMKFILLILYSLKYCKKFHLLLHEGSNIFCLCSDFMFLDFNPYSHEGSDYFISRIIRRGVISIHTPTKGVTAILSNLGLLFFNFFHQFPN